MVHDLATLGRQESMTVLDVIREARDKRGITTAELARRTNIDYEALRVSLKGKRGITGPELISLCRELDLDVDDFPESVEEPSLD